MSATAESPPRTKLTAPAGGSTNRWLILVIACLAQFMVVLDATVVNVALPIHSARAELLRLEPAVGRQRVHAHLRRLPVARRPRGRPARS